MRKMNRSGIDYKSKYMDLRARFIEALDLSFRQGYEQGQMQAQLESSQQQAQMAMQMQQQNNQMPPGAEQALQGAQEQAPQEAQDAYGSELDQLIGELEGLVNKSELSPNDIKKSLTKIKENRLHSIIAKNIKASTNSFLSLSKSSKTSESFSVNLPTEDKKAVSMQQKIVEDIFKKWENESADTGNKIAQALSTEAFTKKE